MALLAQIGCSHFGGNFFELGLTTAADQTVHDWMVEDGPDFLLTSTGGAIMLNRNININGRGVWVSQVERQ